jgi:DNA-directed RNA polymerase sigma subunit (sigma70/sigma32)
MASQLPAGYEPGLDHPPQQSSPQHLVASFLSQDEQEPPPGVSPLTAAFPRDAIHTGARQRLDDRSARLIAAYFATEATLASCGQASGTSTKRVRQLIGSGLRTL